MEHCYLEIPDAFARLIKGRTKGVNVLRPVQASNGSWYISLNVVNEFPELFKGKGQTTFSIAWLTVDDFPPPPDISEAMKA